MRVFTALQAAGLATLLPINTWAGLTPVPTAVEAPQVQYSAVEPAAEMTPLTKAAILHEGEDLRFAIKWGVVTAGYSSLKVETVETINDRRTHHVVAEARSTGFVSTMYRVKDRNETWIDLQTPGTMRYARNIQEGKYRLDEQVELDPTTRRFSLRAYRADKKKHVTHEGDIPANVLDVLGSFYYVRTLPLEVGKSFTIDVHSGNKVYPMVVNVKARQKVKVKAGKFDCFLLEPQLREPGIFISKGKKLEVFVTADERRMPVLMRSEVFIGHVAAELVSHRTLPLKETYRITQGEKPQAAIEASQELQ